MRIIKTTAASDLSPGSDRRFCWPDVNKRACKAVTSSAAANTNRSLVPGVGGTESRRQQHARKVAGIR
jgi:hypothetical protein